MSSIQKTFFSRSGDQFRLTVSGTSVTGNEVFQFASDPIRLSFSKGKHKFIPLRTYSMSIRCITSQDLSNLYSDSDTSTEVTLEQYKSSAWTCIYYGFLVPLAFSQPYSGVNDSFTLTAVDALSAYDNKYYQPLGPTIGRYTGVDYICRICQEIGIEKIIIGPTSSGANPLMIKANETCFLTPEFDSGEASYTDVVGAFMSALGYTAMLVGKSLICVKRSETVTRTSYAALINTSTKATTYTIFTNVIPNYTLSAATVRGTDMQISIEQAYGKVSVKPHGTKQGYVVPPLFKSAVSDGEGAIFTLDNGKRCVQPAMLKNTGIDWWTFSSDYQTTWRESDYLNGKSIADTWVGAMPMRYRYWATDEFSGITERKAICIRLGQPSGESHYGVKLFDIKPEYRSVIGLGFKVKCTVASRNVNTLIYPPVLGGASGSQSETGSESGQVTIPGLYIKVAGKYYQLRQHTPFDDGQWLVTPAQAPMEFGISGQKGEKTVRPSDTAVYYYYETGWIANSVIADSENVIEVYCSTISPNSARSFWIFDFCLEKVGALSIADPSYVLNSNQAKEELSADCWFDGNSASAYNGSDGSLLLNMLKSRYRNKHRAIEFTGTKNIHPFSNVIDGTHNNDVLTIDSMEWAVTEDKIRVYCS